MSAKKITPQPPPRAAPEDLDRAIAGLLDLMRRSMEKSKDDLTFQYLVDFMEKYSRVCIRLVTLMKAQTSMAEEQGFASALNQALSELMDEMKAR